MTRLVSPIALNLQDFRLREDVHAAFAETLLHDFSCIFVKSFRNLSAALQDRDPAPKGVKIVSKFEGHRSCPENDEQILGFAARSSTSSLVRQPAVDSDRGYPEELISDPVETRNAFAVTVCSPPLRDRARAQSSCR